MNNTQKDRYEKKLARFLKDYDGLWNKCKDSNGIVSLVRWEEARQNLEKEYGMTETDLQRAYALHRHSSDRHFWCDSQFHKGEQKQRLIAKSERRMKVPDETLEAELKAEDDWIMDVFDEYYDPETDMCR